MKKMLWILAAIVMIGIIACNNRKDAQSTDNAESSNLLMMNPQSEMNGIADFKQSPADSSITGQTDKKQKINQSTPAPRMDWDKKIIKEGQLNVEVKDFQAYNNAVRQIARSLGGYLANEEQSQTEYKIENSAVIKVPVDKFDDAITQLTTNTLKINSKKVSSQDVTGEFIDTRSRMEAKKQVRNRYTDLLKQAKNMEEILNVQSAINSVQEEIESASGRIEYMGHASAYSSIHLVYFQVLDAAAQVTDEKPTFGTQIARAFKNGGLWILDLFVGLVTIWPLFLVAFAALIVYKKMRPQKVKA